MKAHCCELYCDALAEFGIYPSTQDGPCDYTESCAQHVGELLWTGGDAEPSHYLVYPLGDSK